MGRLELKKCIAVLHSVKMKLNQTPIFFPFVWQLSLGWCPVSSLSIIFQHSAKNANRNHKLLIYLLLCYTKDNVTKILVGTVGEVRLYRWLYKTPLLEELLLQSLKLHRKDLIPPLQNKSLLFHLGWYDQIYLCLIHFLEIASYRI